MTINKSQGQSLCRIGIYLSLPVFAHRQLYVALSRATSPDSIKILINNTDTMEHNETKNVVFKLRFTAKTYFNRGLQYDYLSYLLSPLLFFHFHFLLFTVPPYFACFQNITFFIRINHLSPHISLYQNTQPGHDNHLRTES